jgi:hypothetical protein
MLLAMLGEVAESGCQPRGTGDGFESHVVVMRKGKESALDSVDEYGVGR